MKKRSGRLILPFIAAVLCTSGCISQAPVIAGTPTPTCSPTPLAEIFAPVIVTTPEPMDALGNRLDNEGHYDRYIALSNILIYEYDMGTFLDGQCVNSYPYPLEGTVSIVYRSEDNRICGIGTLHAADGTTVFQPGTTSVYAEIMTDINVTEMNYSIEIEKPFEPVNE